MRKDPTGVVMCEHEIPQASSSAGVFVKVVHPFTLGTVTKVNKQSADPFPVQVEFEVELSSTVCEVLF